MPILSSTRVVAAALLAGCLGATGTALAATVNYQAVLTGLAEAPANNSPGIGRALVTLDDSNFTMRVIADFSGLTANVTAAHIHCCTSLPLAGTAGVASVTPTFTGFPAAMSGSYDRTFDMTVVAGSWNQGFVNNNGGQPATAFQALRRGLDEGRAYLNIHTSAFPGGEIRGFLQLPEPGTLALVAAALAAGGLARRRRSA